MTPERIAEIRAEAAKRAAFDSRDYAASDLVPEALAEVERLRAALSYVGYVAKKIETGDSTGDSTVGEYVDGILFKRDGDA